MHSVVYILSPALVLVVGYAVWHIADSFRVKTFCPNCGNEMDADHTKYRYTVEWSCRECGSSFEQLRNEK